MDVLVAGAGIGGLALAHGLLAQGHRVRVLERADGPRPGGAAVTLYSNGTAALAGLGVPLPDGLGGRIDSLEMQAPDGRRYGRFDMRVMRSRTGFPVVTVAREELLGFLTTGLPPDIVLYGRGVDSATVDGGTVTVTDALGDVHHPDVLVGADGHRSVVRRSTVDPHPAREVGWTTWQGLSVVLPELAGGNDAVCVVGEPGLCGLMPAGGGRLQWWFDVRDSPTGPSPVAWLRELFSSYGYPVKQLLAEVDDRDVQPFPHVAHTILKEWGTGPTTLVGDAAHAFPPSQAQGANQALEDAWLLARSLPPTGDPTPFLRTYEKRRTPRVRLVSRMAVREITNKPPGPVGRLTGRLLTPHRSGALYYSLIRRFSTILAKR